MDESILNNVKSYLGISEDEDAFDTDILMAINAVMMVLFQYGVGPSDSPFIVEDDSVTWEDFLDGQPIGGIRQYVNMRTRLLFDPPANNQLMGALKEQIEEFEVRIMYDVDKKEASSE